MRFKGEPNLYVRLVRPVGLLKGFHFDSDGFYETDNPVIIERMKVQFQPVSQPVEDTPAPPVYSCKQCEFRTENRGTLMAHYRANHPKEE